MRIALVACLGSFLGAGVLLAAPAGDSRSETTPAPRTSAPHRIERRPAAPTPEKAKKPPEGLPPKLKGVIPEGIRKGPNMINPVAPKEFGYGERFMSKSPMTPHIPYSAGQTEVMTPGGGLELFTWEW